MEEKLSLKEVRRWGEPRKLAEGEQFSSQKKLLFDVIPNRPIEFPQVSRASRDTLQFVAPEPAPWIRHDKIRLDGNLLEYSPRPRLINDSLCRNLPHLISGCRTVVRPGLA